MMKIFLKLNRAAAWCLFLAAIVYAFSGYAMVKGLPLPAAAKLHLHWLGPVALLAFVLHSSFSIHLALRRWNFWNKFSQTVLIIFFLILTGALVYLDSFYRVVRPQVSQTAEQTDVSAAANQEKIFTLSELARYDGRNGQPAYAAIDGVVYDFSSVFRNGYHYGYQAGRDLSQDFHNQHAQSYLKGFLIVGQLK